MKSHVLFPAIAALLIGAPLPALAETQAPAPLAQSIWSRFSSPEGGFSVLFPGAPRKLQQKVQFAANQSTEMFMFLVERRQEATYAVAYNDYPITGGSLPPEVVRSALNSGRDSVLKSLGAQLVSEQEITLAGHSGREISLRRGNTFVGRIRMYLVGDRLYQVWVIVPPAKEPFLTRSMQGFLDSFALLAEGAPDAPPQ